MIKTTGDENIMWQRVRSVQTISDVEQFYFSEARMLDNRNFTQWLALFSEDIAYTVPARHTPMPNTDLRNTDALHDIKQECSRDLEPPLREDDHLTLTIRVTRALKMNAWAENPPARTQRFVSNVEVFTNDEDMTRALSNTLLSYSRHTQENIIYTFQREDILQSEGESFKIKQRNILLNWTTIEAPSVGLFF